MADAADLKSVVRKDVRVRLPPSAPLSTVQVLYAQRLARASSVAMSHDGTKLWIKRHQISERTLCRPLQSLTCIVQHQLKNRVAFLREQCPVVALGQMIIEYFLNR